MIAIPNPIDPAEYLSLEHQSPIRHEYRRGLVYAMAGGSDRHDRIISNLLTLLNLHLGDSRDCRFFGGGVKVNYKNQFYYYPDAFVTFDSRDREDRQIKRHPKLIVEVLSPGTQTFDSGDKFDDYRQLNSLEEYVLIAQDRQTVEIRRRAADNTWQIAHYGPGDRPALQSIRLDFPISDLYRGLD
ncbi:MAG: Uma2 family endonuclease [Cyanophyceae cyanobacterium]